MRGIPGSVSERGIDKGIGMAGKDQSGHTMGLDIRRRARIVRLIGVSGQLQIQFEGEIAGLLTAHTGVREDRGQYPW